jgi:hypothetical protein
VGGVTVTHKIMYVDLNDAKRHQYKCLWCDYAESEPEVHTVLCMISVSIATHKTAMLAGRIWMGDPIP